LHEPSEWLFIWISIIIIMGVIEALTTGIVTIWFMAGALLALICQLLHLSIWIQIVVFIISSLLLLIFTRPLVKKYVDTKKTSTNADSLINQTALVTKTIAPFNAGQVKIKGQIWTAMNINAQENIDTGEEVFIIKIEGVKLIVRKINKEETSC